MGNVNWSEITEAFNNFIEDGTHLEVRVYSPSFDKALEVVIPERSVEDFMKALPLFEAKVTNGDRQRW
jgi:hypothetical protein